MLHDRAAVHWHTGEAFDPETLARRSPVTRSELFHWLKANCLPSVEAAYEYPHVPKLPKSYYLPRTYRRSHRSRLRELVDTFNADTPTDRGLLLAAILTCGWGGNPGTRPAYVLTSDYGQSSGKTATARVIGSIWGGAVPLDYSPQWTEVSKRIFSSDDYLSRVFLFDNIKGKSFGGTGIETAITSKRLSGHRMYVGTVSRPNDALWVITFNMPSLTRDMSERSVTVRIGKPQGGTDWLEWAEAFVENHREEILAEVFEILSQPAAVKVTGKDRWGVWHREVLGRITPDRFPGIPDGDALSKAVVARRGELDDEVEDRVGLLEAVASYLCASDRGPKGRDGGRVPLTYTEAARLIQDAGYWVPPRGDLAPNIEAREAVRAVEKSFMGTGILTKSKSKVRVDGRGVPTLAGAKQSRFWMLDWGVVKGLGVNPTSQGGGGLLPPR